MVIIFHLFFHQGRKVQKLHILSDSANKKSVMLAIFQFMNRIRVFSNAKCNCQPPDITFDAIQFLHEEVPSYKQNCAQIMKLLR
jgi:hypothetical protein